MLAAMGQVECHNLDGWQDVLWDPTASAGGMATLAALLAGFAVSGLVWVAAADDDGRPRSTVGIAGLWGAVVPLVLATLLFAEISGEEDCGRAMVGTTVASTLLTIGTVSVLIALATLLSERFGQELGQLSSAITWIVLILGAASTFLGNVTTMDALEGFGWINTWQALAQIVILVATLILRANLRWLSRVEGLSAYAAVGLGAIAFLLYYVAAVGEPLSWFATAVGWGRVVTWGLFAMALRQDRLIAPSPTATESLSAD